VAFNDLANAAAAQLRRRPHHATSVCFLDQASGSLVDTHKRLVLDDFNISAKLRNHHARPRATVAHTRAQRDNGLPNDVGYLTDSTRHPARTRARVLVQRVESWAIVLAANVIASFFSGVG
jgi:hypothetical protein